MFLIMLIFNFTLVFYLYLMYIILITLKNGSGKMIFPIIVTAVVVILVFSILNVKNSVKAKEVDRFINNEARQMNIREIEKYMRRIAEEHKNVTYKNNIFVLIKSMNMDWAEIKESYNYLINCPEKFISLVPSSHWIIDNYYIFEKEVKFFNQSIRNKSYEKLPIITEGHYKGFPRVFAIANEMINSTGYHLDEEIIIALLNSYQTITPLTVDELSTFLDMLKICFINNINSVSLKIVDNIKIKSRADKCMDSVLEKHENDEEILRAFDKYILGQEKSFDPSFITHIMYRLKENAIENDILRRWLSKNLQDKDFELSNIIKHEGQSQSKLQVTIGSLIESLRAESTLDYEYLFEKTSWIEKILSSDPVKLYNHMDFETRAEYHNQVKLLAIRLGLSETRIAEMAVELSMINSENNGEAKHSHVGYYIKGNGYRKLRSNLGYNLGIVKKTKNFFKYNISKMYFLTIILTTLGIITGAVVYTQTINPEVGAWMPFLVFVLMFIPALTISVDLVGYFTMKIVRPAKLPSMDFAEGIPDESRTVIIIPSIIPNSKHLNILKERIEKYYLSNKDENLYFALLADLKDAPEKEIDGDKQVINSAIEGINQLNQKYTPDDSRFMLFIRERKWNDKQNCWMAYERKRGKLEQFNKLILGEKVDDFTTIIGNLETITTFKYVITIDEGTELTRDSAKKLIGIMAHPLNRPSFNKDRTLIIDGYTIIQPKIGIRIQGSASTYFSKLFAGQAGIETYTPIMADLYQDLFGQATFTGKGIYDPRVFNEILGDKMPENSILSHDLLESCYVRCATASNVDLMDDFPGTIASFFKREHRWIRGDWQLLPWLINDNPLTKFSKYKIFDNLRRSLIPVSYLLLIFFSVTLLSWDFWAWGSIVLFTTLFPLLIHISKSSSVNLNLYGASFNLLNYFKNMTQTLKQGLVWFSIIPYRAQVAVDAIIRTIYRTFFSHKKMLEWVTAEMTEKALKNDFPSYFRRMWSSPVFGLILIIITAQSEFAIIGLLIGTAWILSPIVSYVIGLPVKLSLSKLNNKQLEKLGIVSRKTWRYFEEFYKEEYNWLIPDNFQVWPENGVAPRTSTTNIGLQLICALSARDFGYIGIVSLVNRIDKVFHTLSKLEKWNGHFYNWYNIETLEPLLPKYVSTVDSGNFVGSLITLKNGLEEYKSELIFNDTILKGLSETIKLSKLEIEQRNPKSIIDWEVYLNDIKNTAKNADKKLHDIEWSKILMKMCNNFLEDIEFFKSKEFTINSTIKDLCDSENENGNFVLEKINSLIKQIDFIIETTDFKPLYHEKRNVFRIGYNATSSMFDNSYYDLLASESRLASFIAIAKGDVPQKHWFKLGRVITLVENKPTLVSWSGTMFEYLMPNLLMKIVPTTLLEQTVIGAVMKQIQYGKRKNIPWGMSEAAYYRFDQHLNYQYRAIGVPGLGFSTNVGRFNVVSPYATVISIGIFPKEVCKNLELLDKLGVQGDYGYYEAVDFQTPNNKSYKEHNVVKSFFAHHQGMSLIALSNYLNNNKMQERFHNEPIVRATDLVLEEKQPRFVIIRDDQKDIVKKDPIKKVQNNDVNRVVNITKPEYPVAHILSNNHYNIMMTSDGSGLSSCENIAINRWRPDYTTDNHGMFFYVQNIDSQEFWSSTYQPTEIEPDNYQTIFSLDKAEFIRKDGDIYTKTEVIVSPQDNTEIRRLTITNNGKNDITFEVTSYFEAVIDEFNSDLSHPAFSKLFIETEFDCDKQMLLATRRPRSSGKERKWIMSTVLVDDKPAEYIEYETDRAKFIGRGNSVKNPESLTRGLHLTNTVGKVLDAIMCLRVRVTVPAGKKRTATYISGITDTREECMRIAFEYRKPHVIEDSYKLALFHKDVEMQYLNIKPKQANAIQEMVGSLYYPSKLMRSSESILSKNVLAQSSLWRFGISGDNPIILLRINDQTELDTVNDMILVYEYLRMKGTRVDLVILNEMQEGYFQELSLKIRDLINNIKVFDTSTRQLGAYLIQMSVLTEEELNLLYTVARIVLTGKDRLLSKKVKNLFIDEPIEKEIPYNFRDDITYNEINLVDDHLELFNGIGGFVKDGSEYVISISDINITPSPWINVIANEKFGFIVSALGAGHTWALNSRENKLTTWTNDPVSEIPSEIIYIRDEISGKYFTPSALPIRENNKYKVRHGFGYTVFEHNSLELEQKTTVFVPEKDSIKIFKVSLNNKCDIARSLSLTYFADIVMGVSRETSVPYIITKMNNTSNIFTAKNPYNGDFRNEILFVSCSEKINSYSADKSSFIGKGGSLAKPESLLYKELPNNCGAGLDPCVALKVNIELEPQEEKEVIFIIGEVQDPSLIEKLVDKYLNIEQTNNEFENIKEYWNNILTQIVVDTPDNSTNYLLNGWLLYQTLACRIFARSAYYQASGAYGFRDQLQDTLSLLNARPEIARNMILQHSTRQFFEGDVQHWWHPYTDGRGVRTRMSDDLLWLPYVTSEYITSTGDNLILDEVTSYIEDSQLSEKEHERYTTPRLSDNFGSIYEHCIKAIDRSIKFGQHGLPFIGCGDWNDGMNKVGVAGKGESVWLAWFLYKVLNMFAPICEMKGDFERSKQYIEVSKQLASSTEENAWDGEWYLRAYFDDGTSLGSRQNIECQIDSIPQSWSVISGAADFERSNIAMESVRNHLVKYEDQLIQLLTPPFDKMVPDPGYIKGYIPGIRENGAQYTHAAVWTVIAFSKLKKGDAAYSLFRMLNPINHTTNYSEAVKYKNEPYVMSADVYSTSPHNGRGGWSWYTGASGWMYSSGVEWILGIKKTGNFLDINPTIPKEWNQYSIKYKYNKTLYNIIVKNPQNIDSGVVLVIVDEKQMADLRIPLVDDMLEHNVEVIMGTNN